jgi:phage baseplate assembly protein W
MQHHGRDGQHQLAMSTLAENKAILGVGWAFPPEPSASGDVAMAAYEEDVREAIRIILGTSPGERVMRPDFGAGLNALLFAPINTTTMSLASHHVQQALVQWEPRIDQITVKASADPPLGRLLIDIRYRVRATNTFYNLVYPFYLAEGQRP